MKSFIKNKKRWFTMVETILSLTIFAIAVSWIILAMNRSYLFINKIKNQIMATNLAREWVEMMYNLRDSNWRKNSGQKDLYRNNAGGSNNEVIGDWLYTIWVVSNENDKSIILKSLNDNDCYTDDWYKKCINDIKVEFTWKYKYRDVDSEKVKEWEIEDLMNWVEFFRIVKVFRTTTKRDKCTDAECPKELQFCVKVFYRDVSQGAVELCSIMTNFEK